jgi:hypothetical protein
VVTVAVYSDGAFSMLAKVVDGTSGPESAAEAGHTGSGWEHCFDFSVQRWHTCCEWRICKNTFLSFVEVGGGFKDVAVTTTYVDNITGL